MTPAAVVIARAPGDPAALAGLAPLFDPDRRAALQALLIRRAAAWAAAAAPGRAFVALAGDHGTTPARFAARDDRIAGLLPPGVTAFPVHGDVPGDVLAAADDRLAGGPVLLAVVNCPWLGPGHAAAALADLASGCGIVFGATLEGGWYLAGLREPRAELLTVAEGVAGGVSPVLRRARELGTEVGMLRHERVLATPGDVAALLADPLLPAELRNAVRA